jgi:RNA recognition motif-containing protein
MCLNALPLQNLRVMIEEPLGPRLSEPVLIPDGAPFPQYHMSSTVFLGNLPPWVTADDIKAWLVAENLVSDAVKVIRNPETQESKGFAFIEAPNEEEMHLIIKRFDRAPLEDRLLRANPAQPPKSRTGASAPPMRREGPHFSAPPVRAASAPTAVAATSGAASGVTSSVASAPASAAASGSQLERSRRGGKKHVRKAQSPQTLFAEELAKAL